MLISAPRLDPAVVAAALPGLLAPRKSLPPKLFYDDEGCRLFGEITRLPEYYPTRTELALLPSVAAAMATVVTVPTALIEYGGSDEIKAAILLDRCPNLVAYVPIDVAAGALDALANRLSRRASLVVAPVVTDFMEPFDLPPEIAGFGRLGFFPGSTIGNLDPAEAARFLVAARELLGARADFLVGVDLHKSPDILVPAYDDAQGVTAAFNLNLLRRLNREAGADFDLDGFRHRACWNEAASRMEMHLVSTRAQTVRIAGRTIEFASGETIHTENSHKYTLQAFGALASHAGWTTARVWTDPAGLFSIHLLRHA